MTTTKEPLKDIVKQSHDFINCKEGCPMPGYPKEKFTGFYIEKENIEEMIKSAVEWLKEELRSKMQPREGGLWFRYTVIGDTIDEAFEDVIKNKTEEKNEKANNFKSD